MRYFIGFFVLASLAAGSFFIFSKNNAVEMVKDLTAEENGENRGEAGKEEIKEEIKDADIGPQKPLENPPASVKAVYLTGWSAGSAKKINYLAKLAEETEINAVVIDIKDYSGYVAYDAEIEEVEKYGAKKIMIPKINALIKKLHDEGIYAVARITVFQDPVLAKARPDLAIHSSVKCQAPNIKCFNSSSTLWLDRKKLAWMDPSSKEVWDYNIAIAKDAASRGFDEINFDYIRFASDGDIKDMVFPFWDGKIPKNRAIKDFFRYLREQLPDIKISADLFGLATVNDGDLGIGQIIEDAYEHFDYVSPMVYPSHYAKGFLGYSNPAKYPYEVVKYSMESALRRLTAATSTPEILAGSESSAIGRRSSVNKLRPWLQDFDLGANYDAEMVRRQIKAVYDAASSTPESINGWMLWSPSNVYTREALLKE